MPMCSDGLKDMFRPNPWDLKKYEEGCKKSYGVTPQPYLVEVLYGGKNISSHSNIIFRCLSHAHTTAILLAASHTYTHAAMGSWIPGMVVGC